MSTYSRMQLLKLVENQQMSPEEALKIIRRTVSVLQASHSISRSRRSRRSR